MKNQFPGIKLTCIRSQSVQFCRIPYRRILYSLRTAKNSCFRRLTAPHFNQLTRWKTFWMNCLHALSGCFPTAKWVRYELFDVTRPMTNREKDNCIHRQMALPQLTNQSAEIMVWCQSISTFILQPSSGWLVTAWERRSITRLKMDISRGKNLRRVEFLHNRTFYAHLDVRNVTCWCL